MEEARQVEVEEEAEAEIWVPMSKGRHVEECLVGFCSPDGRGRYTAPMDRSLTSQAEQAHWVASRGWIPRRKGREDSELAQLERSDYPMRQVESPIGSNLASARLSAQPMNLYFEEDDIEVDVPGVDRPTRRFQVDFVEMAQGCYRSKVVMLGQDLAAPLEPAG